MCPLPQAASECHPDSAGDQPAHRPRRAARKGTPCLCRRTEDSDALLPTGQLSPSAPRGDSQVPAPWPCPCQLMTRRSLQAGRSPRAISADATQSCTLQRRHRACFCRILHGRSVSQVPCSVTERGHDTEGRAWGRDRGSQ